MITNTFVTGYLQWCIAKNGGGYTRRGVAKGLKVPCLIMITEVSIRCQKKPGGWYTAYTHVYPPIHHWVFIHFFRLACRPPGSPLWNPSLKAAVIHDPSLVTGYKSNTESYIIWIIALSHILFLVYRWLEKIYGYFFSQP